MLILSIVLSFNAYANELCTKAQEIQADSSILRAQKWEDIYKSCEKFKHCDDGYIAEGYSDLIVKTLAYKWDQVNVLMKLISKDKDFHAFVIRHIDATADKEELEMIIHNFSKRCPKSTEKNCLEIKNEAKEALQKEAKGGKKMEEKRNDSKDDGVTH